MWHSTTEQGHKKAQKAQRHNLQLSFYVLSVPFRGPCSVIELSILH